MKKGSEVRRIDALGRVVIPINLRKYLNINEDDFLSISLKNEDTLEIKKDNIFCLNNRLLNLICDSLSKSLEGIVFVCDLERIISISKNSRYKQNDLISKSLQFMIKNKENINDKIEVIEGEKEENNFILVKIKGEFNKIIGALVYLQNDKFIENKKIVLQTYGIFIEEMIKR